MTALPLGQLPSHGWLPHKGAGATADQRVATERARTYLSAMLPSTGRAFREQLEAQGFKCLGSVANACIYSRVQTPACDWSTRVTVVVSLHEPTQPSAFLAVSDLDVQALATVQPGLSRCYTL